MGKWVEIHPECCSRALPPSSTASVSWHCPGLVLGVPVHPRMSPPISKQRRARLSLLHPLPPSPSAQSGVVHPAPLTFLSGLVDSLVCLYEDPRLQDSQHHLLLLGHIQGISLDRDVQVYDFLLPFGGGWSLPRKHQPAGEDMGYAMARMLCSLQATQSPPHPQGQLSQARGWEEESPDTLP